MVWPYIYVLLLLLSFAVTMFMAVYAWRRREVASAGVFSWLMLLVSLWTLITFLNTLSGTDDAALFWASVRFLSITTVPVLYFLFVSQYAGFDRWLDP